MDLNLHHLPPTFQLRFNLLLPHRQATTQRHAGQRHRYHVFLLHLRSDVRLPPGADPGTRTPINRLGNYAIELLLRGASLRLRLRIQIRA